MTSIFETMRTWWRRETGREVPWQAEETAKAARKVADAEERERVWKNLERGAQANKVRHALEGWRPNPDMAATMHELEAKGQRPNWLRVDDDTIRPSKAEDLDVAASLELIDKYGRPNTSTAPNLVFEYITPYRLAQALIGDVRLTPPPHKIAEAQRLIGKLGNLYRVRA